MIEDGCVIQFFDPLDDQELSESEINSREKPTIMKCSYQRFPGSFSSCTIIPKTVKP